MLALLLTLAAAQPPEIAPPPGLRTRSRSGREHPHHREATRREPAEARRGVLCRLLQHRAVGPEEGFPDAGYVNVGFGGSVIRDSTHFAPRILAPHKPGTIVFYAGDNDIGAGRKAEQVADDFQAFVAAVRKGNPECRVLFVAVKPSLARWKKFDVQRQANALVREFCEKGERLAFVDVVPLMLGPDGLPVAEFFVKDGLHMTPKGYEVWTAAVNKALK